MLDVSALNARITAIRTQNEQSIRLHNQLTGQLKEKIDRLNSMGGYSLDASADPTQLLTEVQQLRSQVEAEIQKMVAFQTQVVELIEAGRYQEARDLIAHGAGASTAPVPAPVPAPVVPSTPAIPPTPTIPSVPSAPATSTVPSQPSLTPDSSPAGFDLDSLLNSNNL